MSESYVGGDYTASSTKQHTENLKNDKDVLSIVNSYVQDALKRAEVLKSQVKINRNILAIEKAKNLLAQASKELDI